MSYRWYAKNTSTAEKREGFASDKYNAQAFAELAKNEMGFKNVVCDIIGPKGGMWRLRTKERGRGSVWKPVP